MKTLCCTHLQTFAPNSKESPFLPTSPFLVVSWKYRADISAHLELIKDISQDSRPLLPYVLYYLGVSYEVGKL